MRRPLRSSLASVAMRPSVVGCSAARSLRKPTSRSALAGLGPRVTLRTSPSCRMKSCFRPARSAKPSRRRRPSPVNRITSSILPLMKRCSHATTGAASGASRMLTSGQRNVAAPRLSSISAKRSSSRVSGKAIVRPVKGLDIINGLRCLGADTLIGFSGHDNLTLQPVTPPQIPLLKETVDGRFNQYQNSPNSVRGPLMLRVGKLTDYGTVVMTYLARDARGLHSANEIAAELGLALPTVSKLLKALVQNGLLASHRGVKGGYSLAMAPEDISVARIITAIDSDSLPPGLNEDIICALSAKKDEPEFLLEWRLNAYRHWLTMTEPTWAHVHYPAVDFQALSYYSAPKSKKDGPKSLDEGDPQLLETYEKLGIPLHERARLAGVAVDAVFDSVSVATTFKGKLAEKGVIFCSFSEAVREHPELIKQYLGTVVPTGDNYYAALNSAVFSDGSFVYIPKGVRCPMELSTYFRINAANTGQFERTLIIADEGSYVSYLEGCTAPMRDENQLHAAVVELVALKVAQINYSTVQNCYPGDAQGRGGIYNFVTKRGACRGANSKISWTQVETGSAITWKYPSCVLEGDNSVGEFYSVALANNYQQADTGTKMIHIGRNTTSTIVSKGISAGHGQNAYRGLVKILKSAEGARNYTQCDSLLLGDKCGAHTFPYIAVKNPTAKVEHEATTSKISEDQLFYCKQRGLSAEDAVSMIVNGFCKEVIKELPMEFAVEAQNLLGVSLEGSVG